MSTCPQCNSSFAAARSKLYCSTTCQSKAANERTNARRGVKTPRRALTLIRSEDPSHGQPPPRAEGVLKPLEIEWLDCWPDLHRAVAGRLNQTKAGESIRREDATGNDRQPLAHAVFVDGHWLGKVRQRGAVVWPPNVWAVSKPRRSRRAPSRRPAGACRRDAAPRRLISNQEHVNDLPHPNLVANGIEALSESDKAAFLALSVIGSDGRHGVGGGSRSLLKHGADPLDRLRASFAEGNILPVTLAAITRSANIPASIRGDRGS
jgi:hypothetical protein